MTECPGFAFQSPVYTRGVIFADETQVYGIRLVIGNDATDIGSFGKGDTPWILEEFSAED